MKRFILNMVCLLALAAVAGSCGRSDRITGTNAGAADRNASAARQYPAEALVETPVQTVALIAGRTTGMGTVKLWVDQGRLVVQYEAQPHWVLNTTHLAVAPSIAGIPLNPAGNPTVGHFPYSVVHASPVPQYTYSIDLAAAGLEEAPSLEVAAQADVSLLSEGGGVIRSEGAWAQGEPFDLVQGGPGKGNSGQGGNWAMHFSVDMNMLRGLLLWNKLGSQAEVQHSVVGPDGVIDGEVAYLPAEYGNGFKPLPRMGDHDVPANFIDFPGLQLGQKGCIELWYKPDFNDWQVGHIVDLMAYGVPGPGSGGSDFYIHFNDWQDLFDWTFFQTAASGNAAGGSLRPSSTPSWSTTTPFHVAFTWDGTQPSNRVKVFFNGAPVGNFSMSGNVTFSGWNPLSVLRLGSRTWSGDWDRHNWEGGHALIDNVRVWSYPKTDFSDRLHE